MYNARVHKNFYASGFLYHPGSGQILLQQNLDNPQPNWTLLGGAVGKNFYDHVKGLLKLKIDKRDVHEVYDYRHPTLKKKHYVSYVEINKKAQFSPIKNLAFSWFGIKDVSKLPVSSQTKQDIIVGFRVIGSSLRKTAGEQTID